MTPAPAATRLLSSAVLVHALGVAAFVYTRAGLGLGNVALMEWGVGHDAIFLAERIGAAVLVLLAVVLCARPMAALAFAIGGLVLVETLAVWRFGGFPFAESTPAAQALRWGTPLALGVLLLGRPVAAAWMLRVAIATVFITHGLEAIGRHPGFIDLLIGTMRRWVGYRLTETDAVALLRVIGVVDLIVGTAVLVGRWRPLLAWLALWGGVTALSRVTALGWMSTPEVLVRAAHVAAPLAVWWLAARPAPAAAPNPTPPMARTLDPATP